MRSKCSDILSVTLYQKEGMSCCRSKSLWVRPHTHAHKLIPAEKTNQCQEMCSNSCLSDWLSLHQNCTFNKWLSLSLSGQKDNSSVCAWSDYSIPLLFFPAPFTHKSRVTDTPEQWNHTNAQKTQREYTQGAWESFWALPREKGGALRVGKKKFFNSQTEKHPKT